MIENSVLKAADVMSRPVVSVHPLDSIRTAARLMAQHRISGLPVLDEAGHLVGLVSEADLIRWSDEPTERQTRWLDMLAEGYQLAPEFLETVLSERAKVRAVMRHDVVTVDAAASLRQVAAILTERGIKRVPVMADGRLVGMLTRRDLVAAMLRG